MKLLFSYPLWVLTQRGPKYDFPSISLFFFSFQVIFFSKPFIFDEMFYLIDIVYLKGIPEKSRCFSKKLKF